MSNPKFKQEKQSLNESRRDTFRFAGAGVGRQPIAASATSRAGA